MKKIFQTVMAFFASVLFMSDKVSAALLYGIEPVSYAPPPTVVYWTLEKILTIIVLPIVTVIVVVIGIVLYIKRKSKKADAQVQGDTQNRKS